MFLLLLSEGPQCGIVPVHCIESISLERLETRLNTNLGGVLLLRWKPNKFTSYLNRCLGDCGNRSVSNLVSVQESSCCVLETVILMLLYN